MFKFKCKHLSVIVVEYEHSNKSSNGGYVYQEKTKATKAKCLKCGKEFLL